MSKFVIEVKESRRKVSWNERFITAFNQGQTRNYLYPVYTPAGQAVTDETPCDHPHHRSIWIAAEMVNGYNFYVESTYAGRVPGSIRETNSAYEEMEDDWLRMTQSLEWRGQPDWSHQNGRLLLTETRTTDIQPGEVSNLITIRSQLVPGEDARVGDTASDTVTIGPTKHSYYGVRLADPLHVTQGGTMKDSEGRTNEAEIFDQPADWIDAHGRLAFGKVAGIGVIPDASFDGVPWMVRDYGSIMISTMRTQAVDVTSESPLDQTVRFVIHDGDHQEADMAGEFERFRSSGWGGRASR